MSSNQNKGFFLSIEGIEGVGKSTAVKFIEKYLKEKNIDFILTREPGGTEIAEQIRQILLKHDNEEPILPITELLLMFASRAQHVELVIKPALQNNKWVVSDRFVDAAYAYQGGGRNLPWDQIAELEKWTVKEFKPNITILLDAPADIGLTRTQGRGVSDRIEREKSDFFKRVREAYLERAKLEPARFHVIDATQTIDLVESEIKKILELLTA